MDELITVLTNECEEYRKLAKLSEKKKAIIIKGDIISLQEITDKEQEITSVILNLENKRESITEDVAIVLNKDKKDLKLDNLIKLLENQPKEREALSQVQRNLRSVLYDMSRLNKQNEILIARSLEMVEFDIELFKSMHQAPETANYDKHAENAGVHLREGSFDSKS